MSAFLAFVGCIGTTAAVESQMPSTRFAHWIGTLVFLYTLAPFARLTFLKGQQEADYWKIAVAIAGIGGVLTYLPKPPEVIYITAAILIVSVSVIAGKWLKRWG
ncbi:MAG TPA: hypothetical protein VFA59_16015 [Vicinamibacterales bacterium]|nr:hypothetical protein [Vicinamibacterales bacterium]